MFLKEVHSLSSAYVSKSGHHWENIGVRNNFIISVSQEYQTVGLGGISPIREHML